MPPLIAITPGDPAGIGPEIVAKAFRDTPELLRGCFVAGDPAVIRRAAHCLAGPGQTPLPVLQLAQPGDAHQAPPRCVPVWPLPGAVPLAADALPAWGQVSAHAGRLAADSVRWAAQAALRGEVAALVTAPLHKEALGAAGEPFPGHTELLQAEAAAFLGRAVAEVPVRMMLANRELRVVLVSIHVALRAAIAAVTPGNVLQTLRITDAALTPVLGRRPRIAVAGLNPHAGEGGLFGPEETDAIAPAIAAARGEGIDATGPLPPDTVFMRARQGAFDVVVAMYHDQGLIPVKYLGLDHGVNVTLGLPLVRTSPDHGTAFDIAGTGQADPSSLVEAIAMARQLVAGG
ncbi:MAG TPA: 4-hydroxythreonine-4-phosphate dehydrogenase PdxA [Burkholderiaceae bacterium]